MHELSITQSVVDAVVERMGDAPIRRVRLEIGKLSGIVPDSVRFCFDLVAEGTTLHGAELEIVEPAGAAHCRDCGADFTAADMIVLCPECGGATVDVHSGQDLRIILVEVSPACAPPAVAPMTPE